MGPRCRDKINTPRMTVANFMVVHMIQLSDIDFEEKFEIGSYFRETFQCPPAKS